MIAALVRRLRRRSMLLPHSQIGQLLFSQAHIKTQEFFTDRHGQCHTIDVLDLPHHRFLRDHLDEPDSDHDYARYLRASWEFYLGSEANTAARRRARVHEFVALYRDLERRRELGARPVREPVEVSRRPDGRLLLVTGNHRAAAALRLGLDLPATLIPPAEFLRRAVDVPGEYFGTGRLDRPYPSLYDRGRELVRGRRRDLLQRIGRVRREDLAGCTLLDLGANVGMDGFLASERGVLRTVSVERSAELATAAVRLNSYYVTPSFVVLHDLETPLPDRGRFDTVFCFSVLGHLESRDGIVTTLRRALGRALYVEGHAGSSATDLHWLFDALELGRPELLGFGCDAADSERRTRPLFRVERRPP